MGSKWISMEKKEKLKAGLAAGKKISELTKELGLKRSYIYNFKRQNTMATPMIKTSPKVSVGVTNTVFRESLDEVANLKTELNLKNEIILDLLSQIIILKNANIRV